MFSPRYHRYIILLLLDTVPPSPPPWFCCFVRRGREVNEVDDDEQATDNGFEFTMYLLIPTSKFEFDWIFSFSSLSSPPTFVCLASRF